MKLNIIVKVFGPFKKKNIKKKTPDDDLKNFNFSLFRHIMKIMNENSVYIFAPLNQLNFDVVT